MIAIVDYGMGNAGSIQNMLTRIGASAVITSHPGEIASADKLVLPGVGSFDRALANLDELGLLPVLQERVREAGVPVLGICLGMQLFTMRSDEGARPGLGWIEGETTRFDFAEGASPLRLPHMGWNTVEWARPHVLNEGAPPESRYYFVHSYRVRCHREEDVLAVARYGIPFHAAVARGNVMGTQFHPEKSHRFGKHLLQQFAEGT